MLTLRPCLAFAWALLFVLVEGQAENPGVGYPHDYPGKPKGDFSPAWQEYFEVTHPLPNITWPLPRNFAGNIPVDRPGHPNDTLFFWAFEKEPGSLTAGEFEREDEPWGIWLQGGPGSSSLLGLLFENGPIHVAPDYSLYSNPYGWDHLADYIWVDQPVGVGFGTADNTGFVADEDQMGEDFMIARFSRKPGQGVPESEAQTATYHRRKLCGDPYITKTYFGVEDPPVKLAKIAIGDGTLGNNFVSEDLPTLTVIQTYPQLIGYDPDVFKYFQEQSHLCGYDINLTYPQDGHFPTLNPQVSTASDSVRISKRATKKRLLKNALEADAPMKRSNISARSLELDHERARRKEQWKRDLTGRANGTIDPWYGCDVYDEMIDYALNFSLPWKGNTENGFDVYYVPDALQPEAAMDASLFLNGNSVRNGDPSVEPMAFLTELATNATREHVGIVIYSGNDDSLVTHRGSEVSIQNTTFGGIQGFTIRPSTPWYDDNGEFSGIVHQERNWTYILIKGAGHRVPMQQPERAFVLLREFILGNNETGLVKTVRGHTTIVGGTDPAFDGILTGQSGIYYGSGATQGTYTYPALTIAEWQTFINAATQTPFVPSSTASHHVTRTAP
ncbi:hypothetical protein NM688_g5411 [Phlebia brevispora]|uniref:Uncharacterized protein n=1 Tax=Phlebia brevispora TaxID=194682 RepID=A0ACC1SVX8_9APHY|nr:hypothetical protein NM688_g5411 [Phlebia brevispora]